MLSQELRHELADKRRKLDKLNDEGRRLSQEGARPVAQPNLIQLNSHWTEIESRFLQYRKPVEEEAFVERTVTVVEATFNFQVCQTFEL